MNILKKILLCVFTITLFTSPVNAKTVVDSQPSDANDITKGVDTTQDKKTEYTSANVDNSETTSVTICATKSGHVVVALPKTLILDSDGNATYQVKVRGDIAGNQKVNITIEPETSIVEINGKTSNATANLGFNEGKDAKVTTSSNDLVGNDVERVYTGKVTCKNLSAGVWKTLARFKVEIVTE